MARELQLESLKEFAAPSCHNCFHGYSLKGEKGRRIPLLLSCGHTFCSACLGQMGRVQQHSGAIACPECAVPTQYSVQYDPTRQLVPNLRLLGTLTALSLKLLRVPGYSPATLPAVVVGDPDGLDLQLQPDEKPYVMTMCEECEEAYATTKCFMCVSVYCDVCFQTVHAASKSLRKHTSLPITSAESSVELCPAHPMEPLRHYCEEDEVAICSSCTITGEHKGHGVISINQAAERFRGEVGPLLANCKVEVKHMRKAEKAISARVPKFNQQLLSRAKEVQLAFDDLTSVLQRRELSVLEHIVQMGTEMCLPDLKMREELKQATGRIVKVQSTAQDAMGDDLKLVKVGKKLMSDLREIEVPTPKAGNDHGILRFSIQSAVRQQLMEIGSVSLSPASSKGFLQSHSMNNVSTDDSHSDISLPSDLPPEVSVTKPTTPSGSPPSERSSRPPSELSPVRADSSSPKVVLPMSRLSLEREGSGLSGGSRSSTPGSGKSKGGKRSGRSISPSVKLEETVEVWVSHVESPSEFYVVYKREGGQRKAIREAVNKHCRKPQPFQARDVVPGLRCAAWYDPDKSWYRVTVESCDIPNSSFSPLAPVYVTVVYTDSGSTGIASLEALCSLPEQLASLPPLCIKCTLHLVSPMPRSTHVAPLDWSTQAITQFKSLLRVHGEETIRLKEFDREPSGLAQVDLYLPSAGPSLFSVSDHLHSMGVAKRAQTRGKEREMGVTVPAHPRLYPGDSVQVYIPTVHTPWDFYIQMCSNEGDLESLRDRLDSEFSGTRSSRTAPIQQPEKDMLCCCRYSEDNLWYRAQIVSVNDSSPGTVEVQYFDYGNEEEVPVSALVALPHYLADLPIQAVHCTLWGVEPVDGTEWEPEATYQFCDLAESAVLTMSVCGEGSPLPVILTGSKQESLSETLVEQNLARFSSNPFEHTRHNGDSNSSVKTDRLRSQPKLLTPTDFTVTPSPRQQLSSSGLQPHTPDCSPPLSNVSSQIIANHSTPTPSIPPPSLPPVGATISCQVVQVTSPTDFHISVVSESSAGLADTLAGVEAVPESTDRWSVGEYALANFGGDSTWHRVVIVDVCDRFHYRVSYVDYGNTYVVEASSMVPLPPSLLLPPAQALRCALSEVCPVGEVSAVGVWPHEASVCFSQLAMEKPATATVQALPATPSGPLLISLSLMEQEGGMDNVATILVASGVAIPSPRTPPLPPKPGNGSLANSTASPPSLVKSEGSSGANVGGAMLGGYLPASSPPQGTFTLAVTVVDLDGTIFGHIVDEDILLPEVMEMLQSVCPTQPRLTSVGKLVVGQPCCAIFEEDGEWYRGQVLSIDTGSNTAKVLFVDYGNVEIVECSQIVSKPIKLDVPIQACTVKLAGTKGKVWRQEELTHLQNILIDRDVIGERDVGDMGYVHLSVDGTDVISSF